MNKQVLLLTLRVFSATGGIEKMCRILGNALYDLCGSSAKSCLKIFSMYDVKDDVDAKYFPAELFSGYGINKIRFVYCSVLQGIKSDVVILSHVNLLKVGFIIKLFSPKTKLVLMAHGIEVWKSFPFFKKMMLRKCDRILPVSDYTRSVVISNNQPFAESKFAVLNNCLDPFLSKTLDSAKSNELLTRYGFTANHTILLTLTRLSARERYKGYDFVIQSMPALTAIYPNLKYLIVGKFDEVEKQRLDALIAALHLETYVIFAGFVPDEELAEHYNLADIYIMPSKKEGFGLVFIEALFYGKAVIAGNKDGSVDALMNGEMGLLVNPDSKDEITGAVKKVMENKDQYLPDAALLMQKFGYPAYRNNLKTIIENLYVN